MSTRRYKIGLIGYGYWGPKLLRNLARHPRMEVAWVCDRNEPKLAKAKALVPGLRGITTLDDEALSQLDAVAICTQAGTHYALAERALKQGVHVFLEKPPALTADEARALLALASSRNLRVMVDHTYLYTPEYAAVKRLVSQGGLGRLRQFHSVRADFGLFQKDVNIVLHLLYHDIYLLLDLLEDDDVLEVKAGGNGFVVPGLEDVVSVYLGMRSGAVATLIDSMLFPIKKREIVLSGDRGILLWDDTATAKLRLFDKRVRFDPGNRAFTYDCGREIALEAAGTEALETCVSRFAEYLDGTITPPSSLDRAVHVLELLARIQRLIASTREN